LAQIQKPVDRTYHQTAADKITNRRDDDIEERAAQG
jgi:hypothetical protein